MKWLYMYVHFLTKAMLSLFLSTFFLQATAQVLNEIELDTDIKLTASNLEKVNQGTLLMMRYEVMKYQDAYKIWLLDTDFQTNKTTSIDNIKSSHTFLGIQETPETYLLYFEVEKAELAIEIFKIDKKTFTVSKESLFPERDRSAVIKSFVLANNFFLLATARKNTGVKLLRTFDNGQIHEFNYELDKKDVKLINKSDRSGLGLGSQPSEHQTMVIHPEKEQSIYSAHVRTKFYLDSNGQLLLTIDRFDPLMADLVVFRFLADTSQPELSTIETMTLQRPWAGVPNVSANSFIFEDHLFSLTLGNQRLAVDIMELNSLRRVISLSSDAETDQKSIKPEIVKIEGDSYEPEESDQIIEKENRKYRKLSKGVPGITVEGRPDYLVMTLGSYLERKSGGGGTMLPGTGAGGAPTFNYSPGYGSSRYGTTFFYQIKLDKQTFQSKGTLEEYTAMDRLGALFEKSSFELPENENSRAMIKVGQEYFLGFQNSTNNYSIVKIGG